MGHLDSTLQILTISLLLLGRTNEMLFNEAGSVKVEGGLCIATDIGSNA